MPLALIGGRGFVLAIQAELNAETTRGPRRGPGNFTEPDDNSTEPNSREESRRKFKGRRGDSGERTPPPGDRYVWNITLDNGERVELNAFAPENRSVIFGRADDVDEQNITKSKSAYVFSDAGAILAIRSSKKPCIIINTDGLTYDGLITALNTANGTEVAAQTSDELDATAEPLSREEAKNLTTSYPELAKFCDHSPIVQAVPQSGEAEANTTQIVTATFDKLTRINVRRPPPDGERRRGPGGRRGGPPGPPGRRH